MALISAIAAIIVSALTYFLTKQKEREADFRQRKYEDYQELVAAIGGIVGTDATPEARRRFTRASNQMLLLASPAVLKALYAFQDKVTDSNIIKNREIHDRRLTNLIVEIRTDLAIGPLPLPSDFKANLWCSGTLKSPPRKGGSG